MTEDTTPLDPSTAAGAGPATVLTALEARILLRIAGDDAEQRPSD